MNSPSRWVKAVRCSDIPPREGRSVQLGGREIAIFNLQDRFLAIDNRCPHKGGPLAEGIVAGAAVVCPLHAWKVDLQTGSVSRPTSENSCVKVYAVRVVDDVIHVNLSLDTPKGLEDRMPCPQEHSRSAWLFDRETTGELAP
jgi:nitrite reductase (NADH) small subunit